MAKEKFCPDFCGVEPPAVLLCALSGGADSIVLTHCAKALGYQVYAAHLNHRLRGDESTRDEQFVRNFCVSYGIPLAVESVDIGAEAAARGIGVEECGREVRYAFLERQASLLSETLGEPVWIVTAHTLSDNAETLLMNLTRGAGLSGLSGIPPKRGNILRPLLGTTRTAVEEYSNRMGLEFVVDSTNEDVMYTRNRLRHTVIPLFLQMNPSFERTVGRTLQSLREDDQLLCQLADSAYLRIHSKNGLSLELLRKEPDALRARVLLRYCAEQGISVNACLLDRLSALILQNTGRLEGQNGKFFSAARGMLTVRETDLWKPVSEPAVFSDIVFPEHGEFTSETGKRYKIQTFDTVTSETFHKIYKNDFDIWLDCGKICGSVYRRIRKSGDSVKFHPCRPTKPLKKIFSELAIPAAERVKRFVLADDVGVLAVEGIGVAARAACDGDTTRVLCVTAQEDQT